MGAVPIDKRFRLAKWFLISGAIIGIHPFAIIISGPLYLTGSILIYRSRIERRLKLIWVLSTLAVIPIAWGLITGISWAWGI